MGAEPGALERLSAHIARSIVQQIATVSASGQSPPAACKLDLKGYIDGDISSSIDLVKELHRLRLDCGCLVADW